MASLKDMAENWIEQPDEHWKIYLARRMADGRVHGTDWLVHGLWKHIGHATSLRACLDTKLNEYERLWEGKHSLIARELEEWERMGLVKGRPLGKVGAEYRGINLDKAEVESIYERYLSTRKKAKRRKD